MDQFEIYEKIKVGDNVIAKFTNCNKIHTFTGIIEGITKNYYKVKCLENFRKGEDYYIKSNPEYYDENGYSKDKDRILHVSTINDRKHSSNNCVVRIIC